MWNKIQQVITTEKWFRFDTSLALCRVWYVGVKNDSIVVQATMEMYAAGKVVRPTQQIVGSGEVAWKTYRSGPTYRMIRVIMEVPTSEELKKLVGVDFRETRVYLQGVVLLGALELGDDARIALCATGRAGLGFAVGSATPQPKAASQEQEQALALAATLPSHEL
ncbi:MAG: hypothetical protein ACO3YV_05010 [Pelagibacteraceae bacterium]